MKLCHLENANNIILDFFMNKTKGDSPTKKKKKYKTVFKPAYVKSDIFSIILISNICLFSVSNSASHNTYSLIYLIEVDKQTKNAEF